MSFGLIAMALIGDCRSLVERKCDRCGGAIAVGDKVVPVQDEAWHRSCAFASRGTIRAFWNAKPVKAKPGAAVDARQLGLFGGGK